jgi:hypothetical protein
MSTRRDSTTDKRQKNQYRLAFPEESRGAAPMAFEGGTESELAKRTAESPTTEQWMEEVCERENCKQALRRVKANKGSPGIDGMTVEKLSGHLKEHWPVIREQLLNGTYTPQPGETGGNPEAGRRGAQAGHSDRAGSVHPASGDAGIAEELGRNVL